MSLRLYNRVGEENFNSLYIKRKEENMKCNPFYYLEVTDSGIELLDKFTNRSKYGIKTTDADKFMSTVIKPLLEEKTKSEEFLRQFPDQVERKMRTLLESLKHVFLEDTKIQVFYDRLFALVCRVNTDYPGLNTERLKIYMEYSILQERALVFYDKKMYKSEDIINSLPFTEVNTYDIGQLTEIDIKEKISLMNKNDWVIIHTDQIDIKMARCIDKETIRYNRKIFLIQTQETKRKYYLGPIIIPRCTGGLICVKKCKFDKKKISYKAKFEIESEEEFQRNILDEYVYDEILNYTLDKYSNFSTEYSKLLGTQYEFDYVHQVIRRKEIAI